MEDLIKIEVMYKNEINVLKSDLENKHNYFNVQMKQDKDTYKQRLNDAEKKNKEADAKRS